MTIAQLHDIFLECGGKMTTDSRSISGGEIFFALKGENFDGNAYAEKALECGAAYCVVDEGSEAAASGKKGIIAVTDTLKAIQALAYYHREHTLHDGNRIPMLALTGTNGKTTTKELVKAVLSSKYRLTATEGNFNNNLGVPLTLLRITRDTEFAVVEMGASHPGDIRELVDIAHPDYGLVTNVGRAHLLGFGDFEGVKRTKGEMYDYILSVHGTCFVNTDSADLVEMAESRKGLATIPYGKDIQKAVLLPMDEDNPFVGMNVELDGRTFTVHTHLIGSYNADNILTALAVGQHFGVKAEDAVAAIEAYVPTNNRSQMQKTERNCLIVDAYNANPSSMAAALDNFARIGAAGKAVCLGDMLELGEESLAEHVKVLERVAAMDLQSVILVGAEFKAAANALDGFKPRCFDTSDQAAACLEAEPLTGCTVLVKGSRGTRMEKLIPFL